jgi:hypothetical protein
MKNAALALVLWAAFTAIPAKATTAVWLKFVAKTSYRDFRIACSSTSYPNNFFLRVDRKNGRLVGAILKEGNLPLPSAENIIFGQTELAGLTFQKDSQSRFWFRTLTLTPRVVSWVIGHSGSLLCHPSYPIATMAPQAGNFLFTLAEDPGTGKPKGTSSQVTFNGQVRYGDPYTVDMSFVQLDSKP